MRDTFAFSQPAVARAELRDDITPNQRNEYFDIMRDEGLRADILKLSMTEFAGNLLSRGYQFDAVKPNPVIEEP